MFWHSLVSESESESELQKKNKKSVDGVFKPGKLLEVCCFAIGLVKLFGQITRIVFTAVQSMCQSQSYKKRTRVRMVFFSNLGRISEL